jgi:galactonate dehydratase
MKNATTNRKQPAARSRHAEEANRAPAGIKVASVETFLVNARWRNFLFVKITTDNGLVGWGEGTLGWKEFAVEQLIRAFANRYVIGMDPFRIEDLWFKLYQIEHNVGPVMFSAMAGLEIALWDIVGKACNQPVVNLVGGKLRDKVKAYANAWYGSVHDLKRLQQQAEQVVSIGFRALKLDPFGPGGREIDKAELRQAQKVVAAVREVVGPDIDILIECHGRFSVGMAIEAIKGMQQFQPLFCEEPIPANNHESQAWVTEAASALGARVATGEHCYSRYGFADLLERNGAHVIQPDLVYSGGFMETKKIAAMAEAHYVSVAPHNCDGPGRLAASIHLCANIPNFLILETFSHFDVPWRKDLTHGEPKFKDGYYLVPSAPGWGVDYNEEAIRARPGSPECAMNMFSADWERLMCR